MDQSERADQSASGVSDELEPTLERATSTLRDSLREACQANVERADTGELIRIEEVLAIANEAAKEAISVRRRLRGQPRRKSRSVVDVDHERAPAGSRVIRDTGGCEWTVFAVFPSNRSGRAGVRDSFVSGWLTFDSGEETRRLAPIPDHWEGLTNDELLDLCARAERSRRRRRADEAPNP